MKKYLDAQFALKISRTSRTTRIAHDISTGVKEISIKYTKTTRRATAIDAIIGSRIEPATKSIVDDITLILTCFVDSGEKAGL
jgi:hypothetical protein